eukprot:scaffold6918_cov380-Prasinococcus_capsulatus_cf.AAC.13
MAEHGCEGHVEPHAAVAAWLEQKLRLLLDVSCNCSPAHIETVTAFLYDATASTYQRRRHPGVCTTREGCIFVSLDDDGCVNIGCKAPLQWKALAFFLKGPNHTLASPADYDKGVSYGTIRGRHADSLLRIMRGVYLPAMGGTTCAWPERLRKDFVGMNAAARGAIQGAYI